LKLRTCRPPGAKRLSSTGVHPHWRRPPHPAKHLSPASSTDTLLHVRLKNNTMPDPSAAYTVTGGARIGLVNYTWPLAKLIATADRLTLSTTMFGLFGMGTYSFSRDQVLSIERYGWIPLIGEGIRINHSVAEYPEKIVFWCQPTSVLAGLAGIGFSPTHASSETPQRQFPRGFPLRWTPLIILVVIWNLLIGFEMVAHPTGVPSPGPLTLTALWIVFGVSIAAIRLPNVQTLLLKPGRSFEEVKPIFLLVATVSGIMAVVFGIIVASGGFQQKPKANKAALLTPAPPRVQSAMTIQPSTHSRARAQGQV
jgi:hypothetical protein